MDHANVWIKMVVNVRAKSSRINHPNFLKVKLGMLKVFFIDRGLQALNSVAEITTPMTTALLSTITTNSNSSIIISNQEATVVIDKMVSPTIMTNTTTIRTTNLREGDRTIIISTVAVGVVDIPATGTRIRGRRLILLGVRHRRLILGVTSVSRVVISMTTRTDHRSIETSFITIGNRRRQVKQMELFNYGSN